MKKLLTFLLAALLILASAACMGETVPDEPDQTQIAAIEGYEIKYCIRKENPVSEVEIEGEPISPQILLSASMSFEQLVDNSYSIVTARLLGVEQDESVYNLRYYDFEIEQRIKGDADFLPEIRIQIYDYAFGESSVGIMYEDDGYVPPYEIGGTYLLFICKYQNVYHEIIEYSLKMNAFSLLDGDNITNLMQQAQPFEGDCPKDIDSFKDKMASLLENPEENGEAIGSDFIESQDIKEITDFAPVIIEVRKKGEADSESSTILNIYEMELLQIHKGQIEETIRIYANAENDLEESENYLIFLSPPQTKGDYYMLASPQGSVLPVSDTEKYNEAMGYLYPVEEKQGLFARIWEFIGRIFKKN